MGARRAIALASVPLVLLGGTGVAYADNVQNEVSSSAGATLTIASGGSATVKYWIDANSAGGNPGCDATPDAPVTVSISTPTGVTPSPASLEFTQCGNSTTNTKSVSFASSVPNATGYSVTHTDNGGNVNSSSANFTLIVQAQAETAKPTGSVTINSGDAWTKHSLGGVTVALSAADNVGVVKYRLAETQSGLGTATDVAVTPVASFSADDLAFTLTGAEGAAKAVWARFYDAAGNHVDVSDTIGWDKTAPVITYDGPTTVPNAAGWYKIDVVNTFTLTETGSGPDSACAAAFPSGSQTKTTGGEGTTVTVSSDGCTDLAGNSALPVSSAEFKVDKTAPVITDAGPTTQPNAVQWYKTDVVNTFTLTETGSGPDFACAAAFPSDSQSKTTVGEGTAVKVWSDGCTDLAGNSVLPVSSVEFKVDKTAPAVTVTGVAAGAQYVLGEAPTAGCQTTDGLSGVKTNASLVSSGGSVGVITATCSGAEDNAGNTQSSPVSVSYSVIYNWNGFFQPIDNAANQSGATPAATAAGWNKAKSGSAIPVKFSLAGDKGLNIFEAGYPKATKITCPGSLVADTVEETATATTSGLKYDALADQYNYTWKTSATFAGTCQRLEVKLVDGTSHYAFFNFVK